jgi:hypothetical protein
MNRRAIWRCGFSGVGPAMAVVALAMPGASADPSGSATGTVTLGAAVRSVTVSAGTLTANKCYGGILEYGLYVPKSTGPIEPTPDSATMTLPNGFCVTGDITITNGPVAGEIDVAGSPASGTGGTGGWALVQNRTPGQDQYELSALIPPQRPVPPSTTGSPASAQPTSAAGACDLSFDFFAHRTVSCAATAGQVGHEELGVVGPSASTGTATSYIFTATWTAVPAPNP